MNNRIINSYVENFCGQNDFDSNKFLLFSTYQICKKHNLDENMLEKFEMYKNLLVEWNEKMNLTSITDDYEVIMKHFIDSLEIVKYIN